MSQNLETALGRVMFSWNPGIVWFLIAWIKVRWVGSRSVSSRTKTLRLSLISFRAWLDSYVFDTKIPILGSLATWNSTNWNLESQLWVRGHSNNTWHFRGEVGVSKNVTWPFLMVISLVKVDKKRHMGGGVSKKCRKSVTYYLNGP